MSLAEQIAEAWEPGFHRFDIAEQEMVLTRARRVAEHIEAWPCDGVGDQHGHFQCRKDARITALEQAILDIDSKAAPYGSPIMEAGQEFARAYIMPAGPLHRALGIVGRSGRRPEWTGCTHLDCLPECNIQQGFCARAPKPCET